MECIFINIYKDIPKYKLEEKAREMRYDLLISACEKYKLTYLLFAHQLNDNLETFLFRQNYLKLDFIVIVVYMDFVQFHK